MSLIQQPCLQILSELCQAGHVALIKMKTAYAYSQFRKGEQKKRQNAKVTVFIDCIGMKSLST